jgi:N-acetylglucosamine-6-phosphate deacetylase
MQTSPEFVDLQVNGFLGADFNSDELELDVVAQACRRLRSDNVSGILATIITDDVAKMCRRLARIRELRAADPVIAEVIWGIHIEGPFLNEQPGYIGAHPAHAARAADVAIMDRLLEAAGDLVRVVTLAPERDARCEVVRLLAKRGIRVSAGHCDASLEQLRAAIDAGLSMFTHLGNGCPLHLHRHDNIIQRVLSLADNLWIGLIADGIHVPAPALRNVIRLAGTGRVFVVTDAIHAAGRGPGRYHFGGREVVVDEHLATWDETRSHLVGAASAMPDVVQVLRDQVGLSAAEIEQLTAINPRRILADPVSVPRP